VEHATFSPDGKRVLTASLDNTARIWDAATGQSLTLPLKHDAAVEHATFSPDGKRVVTASADNTARVWDMATGQAISPPLKHDNAVRHATFSPDGKWVVTASVDFTARLWDAATGKEVIPPLKHKDAVGRASFSPDGKRVVTECSDNTARLWDAESGKELNQVTIVPPAPPKQQLNLPDNASVADLRKALKNGTPAVRELAAGRLANLGRKAEPALNDLAVTLTNAKNTTKVRTIAAFAIAKIGANAKPVVPALVKTLERSQPLEIRQAAAEALAKITYPANKEAIPDMLDVIENDKDSNVRIWCVWSLMWMTKPEFKEFGADALLTKVLNERDNNMVHVRYTAARTLAHVLRDEAPDRTVEVLLEMLTNRDYKAYDRTDVKVERMSNGPGDHNVNVAPSMAVDSRFYAADALRQLGKKVSGRKDVVDALKAATKDANSQLRQSATAALKSLRVR
jgi:HEAT repeat protein